MLMYKVSDLMDLRYKNERAEVLGTVAHTCNSRVGRFKGWPLSLRLAWPSLFSPE